MEALTIKVEQEWVVPPGKRPILKAPKTVAGYRTIEARGPRLPSTVTLSIRRKSLPE